jgi:hypothetical protein
VYHNSVGLLPSGKQFLDSIASSLSYAFEVGDAGALPALMDQLVGRVCHFTRGHVIAFSFDQIAQMHGMAWCDMIDMCRCELVISILWISLRWHKSNNSRIQFVSITRKSQSSCLSLHFCGNSYHSYPATLPLSDIHAGCLCCRMVPKQQ